jgi:drug/metabolite transporter (DMT)-like permease
MRFIYASDASPSPAELTAVRMLIALVPFSLVLLSVAKDEASRSRKDRRGSSSDGSDGAKKRDVLLLARAGAELGFLNAAGTAFQAFGLERTSATRAGFLLSTINVLVPLGAALTGQKVKPAVFLGVGLACVGVFVSETSGLEPLFSQTVFARGESLAGGSVVAAASASGVVESAVDAFDFGAGDACCLAAAALYSAFTVRLGTYAARLNAAELSAAKALAMTALCVAWWGLERACLGADAAGSAPASVSILWSSASAAGGFGGASAVAVWGAVAYSALAPGALANVLQTRGQSAVPAAEAQLIFATTPVFNAAAAAAALGETATTNTLVGGAVILAASLMPFLADPDEDE